MAAACLSAGAPVSLSDRVRRSLWLGGLCVLALGHGAAMAWGDDRVEGSGHIVTETRPVTGYTGVGVTGSIKAVLRPSGHEGVELRGDDNLLPLLQTRVVDSADGPTLQLRWKDGVKVSDANVVVTVDVRSLRSVSVAGSGTVSGAGLTAEALNVRIAGSGDVKLDKLQATELSVHLAGSGDMRATGRSAKLAVSISGSGDVDTSTLDSDDVNVRIAGSGDASVVAHKALTVSIAGSGDVSYRGEAQPQVSVAGSGKVTRH